MSDRWRFTKSGRVGRGRGHLPDSGGARPVSSPLGPWMCHPFEAGLPRSENHGIRLANPVFRIIDLSPLPSPDVLPKTRMWNHGIHGIHGKRQETLRHLRVSRRGESLAHGLGDSRKVASIPTISSMFFSVCSVCSVVQPLPQNCDKRWESVVIAHLGSPAPSRCRGFRENWLALRTEAGVALQGRDRTSHRLAKAACD